MDTLYRREKTYRLQPGFALVPEKGQPRLLAVAAPLPMPEKADVPQGHMIVDLKAALLCHSDRTQGENPENRGGATRGLERWLPTGGRVILHEVAVTFRWGGPEIQATFPGLEDGDAGTVLVRWPQYLGGTPCECPNCRRGDMKCCYYGFDRIVEFGIKDVPGGGQRRFIIPASAFVPLQGGMRPHWGALVEPTATFANGFNETLAMARATYGPEWPATLDGRKPAALFFGLGPIALFGCMVARRLGFVPIGVSRTPLGKSARAQALVKMGGHYFTVGEEPRSGFKDVLPGHRVYFVAEGSGDADSWSLLDYLSRDGRPERWDPLTAFMLQSIPGAPKQIGFDGGMALTMHTLHSNFVRFFVNSNRRDYQLAQEAILATPADVVESFFTEMDTSFEALARRFWSVWEPETHARLIRTGVWFLGPALPPPT
jgi:threonine dehydrogenase-like Zn-dependent dehydrogenase